VKLNFKILGNDLGEYDITPVEPYLRSLPRLIRAFVTAMAMPEVSPWMKLFATSGIIYFLSPLDIIPDFITGIGFVDDVIIVLLIMQAFLRRVPQPVLERILDGAGDSVFFNVKDGLAACQNTFSEIYAKVMERYDALLGHCEAAAPVVEVADEVKDASGESN